MAEAQALWLPAQRCAAIRRERLPDVPEGWCGIRTRFSAISPGTERLVYLGQVPASLYEAMRCPYMGGAFPFPVKYGYSLVGEVVAGPEAARRQLVHVLHPHQDCCVVRLEDTYPLPAGLPPRRATLASNLETAVNALWDAQVCLGERALVVGFGIIGSLVARLLSLMPGVQVEVVDTAPAKIALATTLGFRARRPEQIVPPFDLAFHASATAAGLQTAVDSVGFEGRVIELSWYGTRAVSVQLGGTFHSQRKRLVSSQVSHIAAPQRPRWDHRRRKDLVFTLLQRSEFDAHITHVVPFDELPQAFAMLMQATPAGLAAVVDYHAEGAIDNV
jgi:NADPH:quinone reductase-like Zn-dependent oxidoreductase